MRRTIARISAMTLLVALLLSTAAFAADSGFKFPEYKKFKLDNGLTVYMMERHNVPLIYVDMVIKAGGVFDGKKYGLANMTADALMFGAGEKTKKEIESEIDFYGAQLGTGAGRTTFGIGSSFHKNDSDRFLGIIKDLLLAPKFDEKEFASYKERMKMRLNNAKQSPDNVVGQYFSKFIYDGHPYGNPQAGTVTTIDTITIDDVKAFHAKYFSPETAAIALVGDFKADEMKAKIEALLGEWKAGEEKVAAIPALEMKPFDKARALLIDKEDANETSFMIGGWGIKFDHPDFPAVNLVNTIIGGRFTSWLNTELRIKAGLTYGARSRFTRMIDGGHFMAYSNTRTDKTEAALDLALMVLNKLQTEGISEEVVRSGKNYVKGNFPRGYESPDNLADFLTDMFIYDIDENYVNEFSAKTEAVTDAKLKEVIAKYFPSKNMQFLFAGKAEAIREIVKKHGEIIEIKLLSDEYLSK